MASRRSPAVIYSPELVQLYAELDHSLDPGPPESLSIPATRPGCTRRSATRQAA